MKKYYLVEVHKTYVEFTEAVCKTKEEAIEKARMYWERWFDSDMKNITLEIRYADEVWDDVDEEYYPDFQNYDTVEWKLNDKFYGLLSFTDATEKWGLADSTLRKAVADGRLKEGIDVQKFGRDWVVTEEAMKSLYGEPEE